MTETSTSSSPAASATPSVDAPPLAPDGAPICYVVDEEPSVRHFLSLVLHGSGVDAVEFPSGAAMRKAMEGRPRREGGGEGRPRRERGEEPPGGNGDGN